MILSWRQGPTYFPTQKKSKTFLFAAVALILAGVLAFGALSFAECRLQRKMISRAFFSPTRHGRLSLIRENRLQSSVFDNKESSVTICAASILYVLEHCCPKQRAIQDNSDIGMALNRKEYCSHMPFLALRPEAGIRRTYR